MEVYKMSQKLGYASPGILFLKKNKKTQLELKIRFNPMKQIIQNTSRIRLCISMYITFRKYQENLIETLCSVSPCIINCNEIIQNYSKMRLCITIYGILIFKKVRKFNWS